MPSVPRRSDDQLHLRGLPSVQFQTEAPSGAFGGGPAAQAVGQAISGLPRVAMDIFMAEKEKADKTAIVDFDTKLTEHENTLLYNPKNGALATRGKNALAVYEPTRDLYQKTVQGYIGGLSNTEQRDAANRLATKRWLAIDKSLQMHQAQESQRYNLEVYQAKMNRSMDLAVASKEGPLVDGKTPVERQIKEMMDATDLMADSSGLDSVVVEQAKNKTKSDTYAAVLKSFLAENKPKAADAFFKANSKNFDAQDAAALGPVVRAKLLEQNVSMIANQSIEVKNPDGYTNLTEAVNSARALADQMKMDPVETDAAIGATLNRARIADAQYKDFLDTNDRQFFNRAIEKLKSGTPLDQAQHELFYVEGYASGLDNTEALKRRQQLSSLYAKDESFYDDAVGKMDSGQKLAWEQIRNMAEGKFGNENVKLPGDDFFTNTKDVFLTEMKHHVIGQTPQQMIQTATKSLENVPVPGTWWSKRPQFIESYEQRAARDAGYARLQSDPAYGRAAVNSAMVQLRNAFRREPTPAELKTYLDALPKNAK